MSATHTFADAPDLDVLIVPGGPGVRNPNTAAIERFIRDRYPTLKHLITICTGAGLAAKSGLLDGKRATTNKSSWKSITPLGPNVKWVSPARWIVDGSIWSSSGVNSGTDLIFAFISQMYSEADAYRISGIVEYERHTDHCWDPFGPRYNVSTIEACNA